MGNTACDRIGSEDRSLQRSRAAYSGEFVRRFPRNIMENCWMNLIAAILGSVRWKLLLGVWDRLDGGCCTGYLCWPGLDKMVGDGPML